MNMVGGEAGRHVGTLDGSAGTGGGCLMLDDLTWHGPAIRGQRGEQPDQLEGDARRDVHREPPPALGLHWQLGRRRELRQTRSPVGPRC